MRGWLTLVLAGLVAGCCSCPPGSQTSIVPNATSGQAAEERPSGQIFLLKPGVWDVFKSYRAKLMPGQDEYFASAPDGAWAWKETPEEALALCQEHSTGPECILFAKNAKILVPYRVQGVQ
jgi:hypothetical protein